MSTSDFVFWISIGVGVFLTLWTTTWDIGRYLVRLKKRNPTFALIDKAVIGIAVFMIFKGGIYLVRMYLGIIPTSYAVVSSLMLGGWAILAVNVFLLPYLDRYPGSGDAE